MVEFRAAGLCVVNDGLCDLRGRGVLLQVALHDGVADGRIDASADEQRMAVAHEVHADAGDEVVLDGSVGKFDERAATDAAAQVREVKRAAARFCELREHDVVGLLARRVGRARAGDVCLMVGQGGKKEFLRFCDTRVGGELFGEEGSGHK